MSLKKCHYKKKTAGGLGKVDSTRGEYAVGEMLHKLWTMMY